MQRFRAIPEPKPKSKPKKVGRPKLAKGEAKGKTVQVRFTADALKRVETAAKGSKQTVSERIRSTLDAAIGGIGNEHRAVRRNSFEYPARPCRPLVIQK